MAPVDEGRSDAPVRVLYRIVKTNPPTLDDFTSNAARGKLLRNPTPELLDRWSGLSAYDGEELARRRALWAIHQGRSLGQFIAILEVEPMVRAEQTFDRGHYTLWGEPAALLACVRWVVPV